ncbi:HAD superfamily hydrolase (TIGR01509 family) [Dysgonomonas hofstadii]|uniref:HAD superfamily hydrolase (TIGR01509 family) n=1 Tax=Dysgonomonas hofstadii TaxID=637886 RepID=A0A840CP93_9BACT|nr:HAD family phosphatase [Dysgonomonas hofstadii]MBB4035918.1 HAD superfamily hydrolase (TIGR01509 family) [Dysgonomonas hofstadii]
MSKKTTILFDFDGVIADTEPQYDIYIDALGEKYNLGIENFALQVKGTTSPDILKKYFSHFSKKEQDIVGKELAEFELKMDFPPVTGVMEFIDYLKSKGYKLGLVTSSQDFKMERALSIMGLNKVFDVEVTAARITEGKPNPMCYLLAAKDLNISPNECIVFEDSFHGIKAGKDAGMYVVGLSTTIPADQLEGKADCVIPDFSDLNKVIEIIEKA